MVAAEECEFLATISVEPFATSTTIMLTYVDRVAFAVAETSSPKAYGGKRDRTLLWFAKNYSTRWSGIGRSFGRSPGLSFF